MADPNRKINLDLPSDDDSDELDPEEISLVKEFEEEFKNRFTDEDVAFTEFCKQKSKAPPIVFPFEPFHHNRGHRGNHRGGRFQNYGQNRNNYDGQRYNNYNRDNRNQNRQSDHYQPQLKRAREDPSQDRN